MSKINEANTTQKTAKTYNALKKQTIAYCRQKISHVNRTFFAEATEDIPRALKELEECVTLLKGIK